MHDQRRRTSLLVGFLALLLCGGPSQAKCFFAKYQVHTKVIDRETGRPLQGARVLVFANSSENAMWQEREAPHADATDENGEFSGVYWFNTTSDWSFFFADRCKKRVRELTVVVDHPNYRAARIVVEAKSLVPVSEGRLLFEVAVPTFALEERDQ